MLCSASATFACLVLTRIGGANNIVWPGCRSRCVFCRCRQRQAASSAPHAARTSNNCACTWRVTRPNQTLLEQIISCLSGMNRAAERIESCYWFLTQTYTSTPVRADTWHLHSWAANRNTRATRLRVVVSYLIWWLKLTMQRKRS